jgi:N-glycosylase/DNA lyase
MKHFEYFNEETNLILKNLTDFNIEEILECGQCFRFEKLAPLSYRITALGRELTLTQSDDTLVIENCSKAEFEEKWINYFDLETDYSLIKKQIAEGDEIMQAAINYAGGIRLLNQEPYECLLSFIISQNNNIPRIKGIISAMSEKYGTNGSFPKLSQLVGVSEEELFALKMGFRNKYIYNAVKQLSEGSVTLDKLFDTDSDSARAELMKIKGVGPKVADCVLLFSLGHRDVFPVDVWVRRVISELYFDGEEQSIKTVSEFAKNKWGALAGFAQQYLFYFARSGEMEKLKSGKN